ncbi:hypothetical protein Tco_1431659 [Tanacetum coccineum]
MTTYCVMVFYRGTQYGVFTESLILPQHLKDNRELRALKKGLVPFLEKNNFDKEVLSLAIGPSNVAKQCNGFITNGLRFLTKSHEEFKKTQNSGVMVEVEGGNYYGKLTSIIDLRRLKI